MKSGHKLGVVDFLLRYEVPCPSISRDVICGKLPLFVFVGLQGKAQQGPVWLGADGVHSDMCRFRHRKLKLACTRQSSAEGHEAAVPSSEALQGR